MLIRFDVFKWQLRISLRKRGAPYGSYPDLGPVKNRDGFLVRDDQLLPTSSAPTEAAPPQESTSH